MAGSAVIGALRVNLGIDTAAFSKGMNNAQSRLAKFGSAMKTGLLVAAAGVATAAGAMTLAIKGTIDAADEMSKTSAKLGIPIEELSRLKYAADLSGISFANLQTGVRRLSANMNDALKGVGEGAEAFKELGVTVANSDGTLKSSSQVMQEIADRFKEMPDGAKKTALAMDIFGKAGADMIPMLNGGSAALGELMAEADKFGQVFTKEMGTQAEAFNDNMSRLKGAFAAVAAQLAQAVLPYLEKFSAWLVDNAPAIGNVIKSILDFSIAIIQLGSDIISFMTGAWASFEAGWNRIIEFRNEVVASLRSLATEIVQAFASLPAQMLEIGGQIIDGLWNGIKAKAGAVKQGAVDIANKVAGGFKSALGIQSPSKVMHEVGVNVMEGLRNGMGSMSADISTLVGDTSNGIQGAFQNIGSSLAGLINGTKSWRDVLADVVGQLSQAIFSQSNMSKMFGGGGGFGGLLSGLFGGLFGFANGGSFNVGGSGGIDSQLVAFKASPNETVSVTKPGQSVGGGEMALTIHVVPDKDGFSAFMVNTADGRIRQAAPSIVSAATSNMNKSLPGMINDYQRRKS